MKTTGRLVNVIRNLLSGKLELTFEVDSEPNVEELTRLGNLDIEAKKKRGSRSLDANKYFHLLIGKLAPVLNCSLAYTKNLMIARYGKPVLLDDGDIMYYKTKAPESYMMELEAPHSFPVGYEKDETIYRIMRGSSDLDSKEMAELINGVVSECKICGIETESPESIERMLALWETNKSR